MESWWWWWQLGLVSSGRVDCLAAMHENPLLSFCIALKKALSGSSRTSTALCHSTVQSESTAQGCGSSGSNAAALHASLRRPERCRSWGALSELKRSWWWLQVDLERLRMAVQQLGSMGRA